MTDERLPPEFHRAVAHLREPVEPDPDAKARLLAAVAADRVARPGPVRPSRRRLRWPVGLGVAALAATLVLIVARRGPGFAAPTDLPVVPGRPVAAGDPALRGAARPRRLEVRLPPAARVNLVGDFNGWDRAATPMRFDPARQRWVAELVLPPGRHAYALIVDDSAWVTDPDAARTAPDELGLARSILVVDSLRY